MKNPEVVYKTKTRDDFLMDVVGDLIKLRHRKGMTQEELNHRIGVADRLVSKWECGMRTPTSFNLYCWADALDGKLIVIPNLDRPSKSSEGHQGVVDYDDQVGESVERYLAKAA
ncbi:helix-turn-helix transcriptional regulator [Gracilimonas sp.]|uniref:helix-turn-helix domain-containing protein n=1 Tax=Gracilimonas sp. TaxID=1974203 RepID=UPI0032F02403